jgi:RNA polymerase sigma factor (sigma-70 family)
MNRQLHNYIKKCRKNDRQAQFDLYHYCFDYLLAICFRYNRQREDAVSLLNDAFLKILLSLDSYDDKKEFLPWIATITVRTAIDQFRSEKAYNSNTDFKENDADLEEIQMKPGQLNEVNEMNLEEIKELVFSLPENERMVFVLYEWEGYKHEEIAIKLQVSARSSKRYLHKAKELLRNSFNQKQALKRVI